MYEGLWDHDELRQFITSRSSSTTATVLPQLPLSFPIHLPSGFDSHHMNINPFLPDDYCFNVIHKNGGVLKLEDDQDSLVCTDNLQTETERSMQEDHHRQWTNDEVLALLRIRSGLGNWFPDFTWEYVSRKLAEMGFKRSSQKCKEKFEESKSTITNISYKNYRFLNQVEVLDHNDEVICHIGSADEHNYNKKPENPVSSSNSSDHHKLGVEKVGQMLDVEQFDKNDQVERSKGMKRKNEQKKNKKRIKLETFKGLCEDIVKKMMTSQEEILEKVLEDMVKRDEEKIAKEEVWKKQEMEKMSKELELMAQEQAIAGDRQAQIIEFLMKFRSNPNPDPNGPTSSNPTSTHSRNIPKLIPISSNHQIHPPPQNPKNANPTAISTTCSSRWPRDEVLALINLRCSHIHANDHIDRDHKHLEKSNKAPPLWERISQGMLALGYRRSAKKCKEKWENINKYFRRTKDVNNKIRSRDSKTCPYFHQLSTLDNNSHRPEYRSISSKNCSGLPETVLGASTVHVVEDGDTN